MLNNLFRKVNFALILLLLINPINLMADTWKHGNNNSVSCNAFCAGTKWGGFSSHCIKGYDNSHGGEISCSNNRFTNGSSNVKCLCSTSWKHGNNNSKSCNDFCDGSKWGGFSGQCLKGYDNKHGGEISCSGNRFTNGASNVKCLCSTISSANFPITAKERTELGDHRRMQSSAKLSESGRLDVTTKIWTDKQWSGFTGGVGIMFLDDKGNVLGGSHTQSYGVNGKRVAGPSSRTEHWVVKVPANIINKVRKLDIKHGTNPKNIRDLINRNIDTVCGATRKITSDTGKFCP